MPVSVWQGRPSSRHMDVPKKSPKGRGACGHARASPTSSTGRHGEQGALGCVWSRLGVRGSRTEVPASQPRISVCTSRHHIWPHPGAAGSPAGKSTLKSTAGCTARGSPAYLPSPSRQEDSWGDQAPLNLFLASQPQPHRLPILTSWVWGPPRRPPALAPRSLCPASRHGSRSQVHFT